VPSIQDNKNLILGVLRVPSGIQDSIVRCKSTEDSEEHIVSTFSVEEKVKKGTNVKQVESCLLCLLPSVRWFLAKDESGIYNCY
jgi:hypothetical protein